MRNHSSARLPNIPPPTFTDWQTLTCHARCHALHAHCKKHLLPTSPIQVSCSLKDCVSLPHKNSPLTRAPVPQVLIIIQRPSCHILVSLRRLPLPQRHPSSRTMRKRYPENACRTRRAKTAKPTHEPTLLQHYLPFLVHAKPSTPTNIG